MMTTSKTLSKTVRRRWFKIAVLLMVVALVVVGSVVIYRSTRQVRLTGAPATGSAPAQSISSLGDLNLSFADDGRRITVNPGATVTVALNSTGRNWSTPTASDPTVLHVVESSSHTNREPEAVFRANRSGNATLSADGGCVAACNSILRWSVTITVK